MMPELADEAARLINLGEAHGLRLRLLGGLGVLDTCPSMGLPTLRRSYPDIDFVTGKASGPATRGLLEASGYRGDQRFNALHGETRLLFYSESGEWQVDVFLGSFSMCHSIDLERSLLPGRRALPVADLLLTKLQIVQMNVKDMKDVMAILLDHRVAAESDPDAIDLGRLVAVTSEDWGLHTTVTDSLAKARTGAADLLEGEALRRATERIAEILEAIQSAPKSKRWRLRSRIGRRIRWYELPDEVAQ